MARTVDTSSTLENWRQNYNTLATEVGDPASLNTGDKDSIVNAINYIQDQYFFFQDFDYDGSDGASTRTVFSGIDNNGNTLQYMASKVLVYKQGLLLRNGTDYTAINGTSITLASSAGASDVIRISSYTGSYTSTPTGQESLFHWQTAGDNIWNRNSGGVVIQSGRDADALVTTPTVTDSIQLDGATYINGELTLSTHLNMGDSDIIKLGASADLQIQHDGSNSYIIDSGTGILFIRASTSVRIQGVNGESSIDCNENGAVNLYYDNAVKLVTAAAGINITGDTDTDTLTVSGNATVGGTLGVTGVVTANAGVVVDTITIDAGQIDQSSGDLTLDVAGDIILDADGDNIWFDAAGTRFFSVSNVSSDVYIGAEVADKDMLFRVNDSDGGGAITALTLDASAAGAAAFNAGVTVGGTLGVTGIATFSAVPVLPAN